MSLLCGCDGVLGLTPIVNPDAPGCIPPAFSDDFTATSPCANWTVGTSSMTNATVVEGNQQLTITTQAMQTAFGSCFEQQAIALPPTGMFVEVTHPLDVPNGYTELQLFNADGGNAVSATMVSKNRTLTLAANGSVVAEVPYDPTVPSWWRIRPVANGLFAEMSPDRRAWSQLGVAAGSVPMHVAILIGAGTDDANEPSATAVFQHLNVCP